MQRTLLITSLDEYSALTGLKPSTLCQYAVENGRLYDNLLAGLDCQVGTAQRLLEWIADPREPAAKKVRRVRAS